MADKVMAGKPAFAENTTDKFPPHPKGPHMMMCVDVIDLGECVKTWQNEPPKLVPMVALVYCSGLLRVVPEIRGHEADMRLIALDELVVALRAVYSVFYGDYSL